MAVHPERILKDLEQLWVSLGRQGEEEGASGVLRACALTLIVVTPENGNGAGVGETLAELMREHPSRAIVVRLRAEPQRLIGATVSAQCWLPSGHRRQICSEQVEITAGRTSLEDVFTVVNGLTAPDLPVAVWCRSANLLQAQGLERFLFLAHKSIFDSSAAGRPEAFLAELAAVSRAGRTVADLSWTRLTRWRETIAQVFECPACQTRKGEITELRVCYSGSFAPAEAHYMAAWLARALEWEAGDPRLRLEAEPGHEDGFRGVRLAAPEMAVSAERREGAAVEVRINGLLHRTIFPVQAEAALLVEELSIAGRDPVYEQCLAVAERIARSVGS